MSRRFLIMAALPAFVLGCLFLLCSGTMAQEKTPSEFYRHFPQWDQAIALRVRLKDAPHVAGRAKSDLLLRFSELQKRHKVLLNGTDPVFQERLAYRKQFEDHNRDAIKQQEEAMAIKAEIDATPSDQRTKEWANWMNERIEKSKGWGARVIKKKNELDQQNVQLRKREDELYKRWACQLKEFIGGIETALGEATTLAPDEARLVTRIWHLTARIEEMQTQLRGLGFKQRAEDFEQIGEVSGKAVARLKAKILEHLLELTTDEAKDAMKESFLNKIKDMKPYELRDMLEKMEKAGVSDPYFLGWMRSFERNKPRAELAEHAMKLIAYLKMGGRFTALFQNAEEPTVDGQQEAVLKLIALVMEHPYLAELKPAKNIGMLTYDVGEAWFFYAVLSMEQKDLAVVTRKQAADQKLLIKRMEKLVEDRNKAREELKGL